MHFWEPFSGGHWTPFWIDPAILSITAPAVWICFLAVKEFDTFIPVVANSACFTSAQMVCHDVLHVGCCCVEETLTKSILVFIALPLLILRRIVARFLTSNCCKCLCVRNSLWVLTCVQFLRMPDIHKYFHEIRRNYQTQPLDADNDSVRQAV
jgi:hypothetical protein